MAVTGLPENPLATTWTCIGRMASLAGLLTITSGAFTVTLVLAEEDAPTLSVTLAVSVKTPALEYVCEAVRPVALVPSPKLITELAIVPSGSEEPAALTLTVAGAYAIPGVAEIAAI